MNRRQKVFRRKLNILTKLFDDLAIDYKRDVFTLIFEYSKLQDAEDSGMNFDVLTQRERRLIWNKLKSDADKQEKDQKQQKEQLVQNLDREVRERVEHDEKAKKMLVVIKQKFLTYQTRLRNDAFQIWKRRTDFVSKTAKYVGIAGNALIINERERIQRLKELLQAKQEELENLKNETYELESTGKSQFLTRKTDRTNLIKKLALRNIIEVIKTRGLRIPFFLLKTNSLYRRKKALMFQQLPRPRKKQWWEKLLDKEYNHFYEEAEKQMRYVPDAYRDLYSLIIEHKRMRDIITIQRFFRKRIMNKWLDDHDLENGQIIEKGKGQNGNNKRLVKVDVRFLEQRRRERGEVDCITF